jgi:hypothetical protein
MQRNAQSFDLSNLQPMHWPHAIASGWPFDSECLKVIGNFPFLEGRRERHPSNGEKQAIGHSRLPPRIGRGERFFR